MGNLSSHIGEPDWPAYLLSQESGVMTEALNDCEQRISGAYPSPIEDRCAEAKLTYTSRRRCEMMFYELKR